METWFIYALVSIVASGLSAFLLKISAEKNLEPSKITQISFAITIPFTALLWYLQGAAVDAFWIVFFIGGLGGVLYSANYIMRIQALQYIDTAIYFPIYKTIGPILVLLVGLFIFGDTLDAYDYAGIALGITVPLMLIHVSEKNRQKNLVKGISLLVITTIIAALAFTTNKIVADTNVNIWLFISIQAVFGLGFGMLLDLYNRYSSNQTKPASWKNVSRMTFGVALLVGLIDMVGVYSLLTALEGGLISIVYTVNSFYILIPIVLSIIFYKEHINLRKASAIGLSILAVIFFQI